MIGAVMLLNGRGDVFLSRTFRSSFDVNHLEHLFRTEVIASTCDDATPIKILHNLCFIYLKLKDMLFVIVTSTRADCFLCLQYGTRFLQLIHSYFGIVDLATCANHFETVLFLLDETIDFGYPQLTDADCLRSIITSHGFQASVFTKASTSEAITRSMSGQHPWRGEGSVYALNEIFVDVCENMNLLMTSDGLVLYKYITGTVVVKSFLSGLPQCEIVLGTSHDVDGSGDSDLSAALQSKCFHPCVELPESEHVDRLVFVPPDKEFAIMRYTAATEADLPIAIVSAAIREFSKTRVEISFALQCRLPGAQCVNDVEVRVPCPENVAAITTDIGKGKAVFLVVERVVIWKLKSIRNSETIPFHAKINLISPTGGGEPTLSAQDPIRINFRCNSHSFTKLRIEKVSVSEPFFRYKANKWIRYFAAAGNYNFRAEKSK